MKRLGLVLLVLCAALGTPAETHADSCSSGGSDSGSSSSGDSSGSYSSYSSSDTTEPSCVETSDIHGRRQCSGFGTWAMGPIMPRLSVEVATSLRVFPATRIAASGTVDHGTSGSYQYRMMGGEPGSADLASAIGTDFRILGGKHLYGGVEAGVARIVGIEGAVTTTTGGEQMPDAAISETVHVLVTTGAVLGARAAVGPLTVSAEVLGGARIHRTEVTSEYGACITTDSDHSVTAALEARGRVDAWLSPWLTVGVFAGRDLRAENTHLVGISLAGHLRAFDGLR